MEMGKLDINEEEVKCEKIVSQNLKETLELNFETFDILGSLFGEISGRVKDTQLEPYQKAHLLLGSRILSDLRAVNILIRKCHTPQAAVIASTILEGSLNMEFIGSSDEKAQKWLKHKDEKRPVWSVTRAIR